MSQSSLSANKCFEQLLTVTFVKLNKLEAIIKQQSLSPADQGTLIGLISNLRQQFSESQLWLVDKTLSASPLNVAREQLQTLCEQLQMVYLPLETHGAISMLSRSLNTYLNLLTGQAMHLRHQHLRHMQIRRPVVMVESLSY